MFLVQCSGSQLGSVEPCPRQCFVKERLSSGKAYLENIVCNFLPINTKTHISIIKILRSPAFCLYKTMEFLKNITLVNPVKIWPRIRRQHLCWRGIF